MLEVGQLYVVATPIGNLEDITLRALTVLKEVAVIAAEDTRQSKRLLHHYGVNTPIFSLHAHNERTQSAKVITYLRNNEAVAYITDAGTPLISDPGAYLVREVHAQGFKIIPVPGPCAAITALSASGFSYPHFYFEGFLPSKSSARQKRLAEISLFDCTLVFYESPHRILEMLEDLLAVLGNCDCVIARELTKRYETILTGKLEELLSRIKNDAEQRLGEFVVLVDNTERDKRFPIEKINTVLAALLEDLPLKKAVALASTLLDVGKNELYELALSLKKNKSTLK